MTINNLNQVIVDYSCVRTQLSLIKFADTGVAKL